MYNAAIIIILKFSFQMCARMFRNYSNTALNTCCKYRNAIMHGLWYDERQSRRSLTEDIPRHFDHVCAFMRSTYRRRWLVCRAGSDWRHRTSDVVVSESRKWCQDTAPRSRSNTRRFCERWSPEDGTRRSPDNCSRPRSRSVSPARADTHKISLVWVPSDIAYPTVQIATVSSVVNL